MGRTSDLRLIPLDLMSAGSDREDVKYETFCRLISSYYDALHDAARTSDTQDCSIAAKFE